MKILICDKETLLLKLLSSELTPHGYHVCTADNGYQAMTLLRAEKPDIVVTNILLPLINGFEFLSQIRKMRSKTAVIVYSSIKSEHIIEQIFLLGARDFITKPFDPEKLVVRIKKLI
jgi:DNA-binding response OmpR family regulator